MEAGVLWTTQEESVLGCGAVGIWVVLPSAYRTSSVMPSETCMQRAVLYTDLQTVFSCPSLVHKEREGARQMHNHLFPYSRVHTEAPLRLRKIQPTVISFHCVNSIMPHSEQINTANTGTQVGAILSPSILRPTDDNRLFTERDQHK
jgi:hypothetical protein